MCVHKYRPPPSFDVLATRICLHLLHHHASFRAFFFVFSKWIAIFTSAGHCSLICFCCFLFFFVLYDRNGFDDCGFIQGALLLFRLFCAAAVGFTGAHGSWLTFPSVTGKGDCFSWLMDGTCG